MTSFRYRAATAGGELQTGSVEALSHAAGIDQLRRTGLAPIELVAVRTPAVAARVRSSAASRTAVATAVGELAVLLGAGLTLDRALAVCVDNIERPAEKAAFAALYRRVKEGVPLSRAMADSGRLFPPMAAAMAEAGESNGRLDEALTKLGDTLERTEALRRTVSAAMIYPALLLVIAIGVILMMLLFVVPQFEGLFGDAGAALPPTTRVVVGISHVVRDDGLAIVAALVIAAWLASVWLRRPASRAALDRVALTLPVIGRLVTSVEIGRFARVLGSLVDGGVPLPEALAISRRSVANSALAAMVGRVALGLKQGGGLTALLAAEPQFPRASLSFVRTGEETARLGPMLARLADVLDREVRARLERLIAILTPLITVVMGAIVATVIASIMTAILGFNDLALTS